MHGIEAGP